MPKLARVHVPPAQPGPPSTSWRAGKTTAQRGYGGRWQRARETFLARPENVLCRMCDAAGLVVVAAVVDHVIPHRGDQALFWDTSNWQPLCKPCHDRRKQREEASANRLDWRPVLPRPACRVVLVAGSPGSGKSSYVRKHKRPGDVVLDLDEIKVDLFGGTSHQTGTDGYTLAAAVAERNRRLAGLGNLRADATAWLVAGAPDPDERRHWRETLGAEVVVMCTPYAHVFERIRNDPTRKGREKMMEGWVLRWWQRYRPDRYDREVHEIERHPGGRVESSKAFPP